MRLFLGILSLTFAPGIALAQDIVRTPQRLSLARTDWSRFQSLPAFEAANRINAFGTYLLLEEEELRRPTP